jgi:hypothetical protein
LINLSGRFSSTFASGKKFFLFLFYNFFRKGFSFFLRFKREFFDLEFDEEKGVPDELLELSWE